MEDGRVTLYDMAKQLAAADNPMDPILFNKTCFEIATDMQSQFAWMLLCKERSDFTVFLNTNNSKQKKIAKELMITLQNRGKVIHMDKQEDGAWEIWVRDLRTDENFAYYLFDYSKAIIDCKE